MSDIATYQAAVKRLTAENRDLKQRLTEQAVAHKRQIRELEAQLNEGLTPELLVLHRQLSHWRDRAQAAEQRLYAIRRVS